MTEKKQIKRVARRMFQAQAVVRDTWGIEPNARVTGQGTTRESATKVAYENAVVKAERGAPGRFQAVPLNGAFLSEKRG